MENQQQPIQSPLPVQPVPPKPISEQKSELKKSLPKWPLIIVGVILLATLITGGYVLSKNQNKQMGCTTEAKICPNGSSVGRTGPKCEFSACPKAPTPTPDPTANWITYTHPSLPFSLKYPADNLTPSFNKVDPYALKNRLSSISSDIDQYIASKYYGNGIDGFDDADNTGLGSLLPLSSFIPNNTYRYRGIRFSQYYLGNNDISTLAPYFRNNKGFSTIQINGVKVGVFDGTTKTTGIPPAYVKTYYFKMGEYVLSVGSFIFASSTQDEKSKIFTLLDNLAKTIKIGDIPTQIPTIIPTATPTPIPFSISSINPMYIPMNYSTLGKNHLTINGFQFQNDASATIEGPYDLGTGQISSGQSYHQFQLSNITFDSNEKLEGTIPDGLPNGYFKIVVKNPDGSSASTGLSLLRGNDPNEK